MFDYYYNNLGVASKHPWLGLAERWPGSLPEWSEVWSVSAGN